MKLLSHHVKHFEGVWRVWNTTQKDYIRNGAGEVETFTERQAAYHEALTPEFVAICEK